MVPFIITFLNSKTHTRPSFGKRVLTKTHFWNAITLFPRRNRETKFGEYEKKSFWHDRAFSAPSAFDNSLLYPRHLCYRSPCLLSILPTHKFLIARCVFPTVPPLPDIIERLVFRSRRSRRSEVCAGKVEFQNGKGGRAQNSINPGVFDLFWKRGGSRYLCKGQLNQKWAAITDVTLGRVCATVENSFIPRLRLSGNRLPRESFAGIPILCQGPL